MHRVIILIIVLILAGVGIVGAALSTQAERTLEALVDRDGTLKGPRITAVTDASTVTLNCATTDQVNITALAQGVTLANPSGSCKDGKLYKFRIKSAASQTITWGAMFRAGTDITPLLAATTGSNKTDYLGFLYNAADTKMDYAAKAVGF